VAAKVLATLREVGQSRASRIETPKQEVAVSEFRNVTVVREANVYFGGGVTSRTLLFPDGSRKTLGIMQPGAYEFNTAAAEVMEILSGDLDVLLPGEKGWRTVKGGQEFRVPANSKFELRVKALSDYCCSFLP
jgi:uncharacterized protein YaiE (UPF0345 family)